MPLVILAAAQAEIDDATAHYEARRTGLGDRLFAEFLVAVENIERHPRGWHPLPAGFRRYRLNRFPHGVVYMVRDEDIVVTAFSHHRRRSGYWRSRLK